jgi:vacuolar-type H+-ATPase subunit F/Vma7
MSAIAFVGDAVTATGYRLAGVTVHVPGAGEEVDAFERARAAAEVVLVASETARHIPVARLEAAMAALSPLVLVIPDASGGAPPVDPAASVRRQLGLAE